MLNAYVALLFETKVVTKQHNASHTSQWAAERWQHLQQYPLLLTTFENLHDIYADALAIIPQTLLSFLSLSTPYILCTLSTSLLHLKPSLPLLTTAQSQRHMKKKNPGADPGGLQPLRLQRSDFPT